MTLAAGRLGRVYRPDPVTDFAGYVDEQRHRLFRFAVVLCGDPVLADDIVAEVLARAYERWDRVSAATNVHAYVRRMVVNEFLSWRRRATRTSPRADLVELADRAAQSPDPGHAHAERAALAAELVRLPRQQRAAIVLRYYEGLPDDEIADVLGCRPVTVRSNISRGLATLRVVMTVPVEED
jgi:RNA polymerase sigma-70 factor (sigma-E family)